jgi:NADH:ubiquinone oxidoreductase subunit 5 (subunit L)/multisubunit Na+/H+ antiporter MnhA subunit
MFISIKIGNNYTCMFHIFIHALSKACLFIVIGNLLHSRFSQQDTRLIFSRTTTLFLTLRIVIRILNLSGFLFISGFFSKEQILFGFIRMRATYVSLIRLLLISRVTLSYCIKLFISVIEINNQSSSLSSPVRAYIISPVFFLRRISLVTGFCLRLNLNLIEVTNNS